MHKYTDEQIQFLREKAPGRDFKGLTKMFNDRFGIKKTRSQIAQICLRHGILNGRGTNKAQTPTLCWSCQHAHAFGCSWHRSFKPVHGWEAEETLLRLGRTAGGEEILSKSYCVRTCPEFVKGRVRREK